MSSASELRAIRLAHPFDRLRRAISPGAFFLLACVPVTAAPGYGVDEEITISTSFEYVEMQGMGGAGGAGGPGGMEEMGGFKDLMFPLAGSPFGADWVGGEAFRFTLRAAGGEHFVYTPTDGVTGVTMSIQLATLASYGGHTGGTLIIDAVEFVNGMGALPTYQTSYPWYFGTAHLHLAINLQVPGGAFSFSGITITGSYQNTLLTSTTWQIGQDARLAMAESLPSVFPSGNFLAVVSPIRDLAGNELANTPYENGEEYDFQPDLVPTAIGLTFVTVAHSQGGGATVGDLSATDPNVGDTHTFTLVEGVGDIDNASFAVVAGPALIVADGRLLAPGEYSVRLRATDSTDLFVEQAFTITVTDDVAPTIVSITRAAEAAQISKEATMTFTVTFSEDVENVTAAKFTVTPVGTSTAVGSVTAVSGGPRIYDVTVAITAGDGEFRLDVLAP